MAGNVIEYISPPWTNFKDSIAISSMSAPECNGFELMYLDSGSASTVWTQNMLVFIPLITTTPLLVSQFYWLNGATVDGNSDAGIYTEDGATKLISTGSTLNAGTSAIQAANVSDTLLPANRRLWLALGCDSATHTYNLANPVISALDFIGNKEQLSGWSSGLPTTIAPATPTIAKLPIFGFTGAAAI